ncbi:proline-rich nuclear receptor coactivator [Parasponia andersonii]|uniref:Proline-rich nuclear receptor coactivator n=1 Tax=Parasponia andersonii TaxID=3476 RepID=A0A2P5E3Y2_PARAD|nr:proline-rich nuclear receptor coactivator [Parasponia andersonii]
MATEVLRPQDCLIDRIRVPRPAAFTRRRSYYGVYPNSTFNGNYSSSNSYANPRSSRKPAVRSEKPQEQRRSVSKRSSSADDLKAVKVEKVTILRRGESLDSKIRSESSSSPLLKEEIIVCGTQRLGPEPEMVPKRIGMVDLKAPVAAGRSDVYAGSAFAVSPAPSSLPLPSFPKKKPVLAVVDDSATRDLRRLLRIG